MIVSPPASSASARKVMQGNRRVDTSPEKAVRSALHRLGLRFRKDFRVRAGDRSVKPDVVFTRQRVAVFVDGCFWHKCPEHGNVPQTNRHYWEPKLARNVERDRANDDALRSEGWTVVRIFEHVPPAEAASAVAAALGGPTR